LNSLQLNELHQLAVLARKNSYSPYSKHKIGSAVFFENNQIFTGVNIENASYGGTVCAERVAIWKGISADSGQKIKDICVVSDAVSPWPPCGMCLQVIAEFATEKTMIHVGNLEKVFHSYKLSELLPKAFTPRHLAES
jgi:cytidine deaminase